MFMCTDLIITSVLFYLEILGDKTDGGCNSTSGPLIKIITANCKDDTILDFLETISGNTNSEFRNFSDTESR